MENPTFKFEFDEIHRIEDTLKPIFIYGQLERFNKQKAPLEHADIISLNFAFLNKKTGKIRGGILADMYNWHIVNLHAIWVMEEYRGKGYGTKLLKAVEEEAKKERGTLIHTDTFDWQAKDFYIKNGYEVFGILEDCPKGHKRFFMKKDI